MSRPRGCGPNHEVLPSCITNITNPSLRLGPYGAEICTDEDLADRSPTEGEHRAGEQRQHRAADPAAGRAEAGAAGPGRPRGHGAGGGLQGAPDHPDADGFGRDPDPPKNR